MVSDEFDETKLEAFGNRMVDVLNMASIALMTSIGHQTGLFDTMADLPPATCLLVAGAAGLNERYVREWLGAMVTGRIVDYEPTNKTYSLPSEHAVLLTREAGTDNMARDMQYISMMAEVEQGIVESFQNGGGVPYSAFQRFQKLMAENSKAGHDASLLKTTLLLVPGLVDQLQAGIDVADVGCGSGHAINLMAQAFPNSRFIGYDFSEEGIRVGQAQAEEMGVSNAKFEARDVSTLDMTQSYDFITAFDAIHDQAQPAIVLQAISRALRSDGVFLMVDIAASSNVDENVDHVLGPYLYTISTMHCMTVSLALDGQGLGTVWGEQLALKMLANAGFTNVEIKRIDTDIFDNYYICGKG
jgi:2-polyprenyl-3-methyl-5-hydroxy-6-metoxy-1,4-benzoquinol methylase